MECQVMEFQENSHGGRVFEKNDQKLFDKKWRQFSKMVIFISLFLVKFYGYQIGEVQ